MLKSKIRPPFKIVTHEDFNLKLGTRDYVADITHQATLGSNRPSGGFPPNTGNITPVWLFWLYCFFSRSCPQVEPPHWLLRWMAQMTCFRPRTVLLRGQDDGWRHMGKIFPKNSPKRGVNGQFQAKTAKKNLYIAISPELLIRRTSDLRSEFRPRKALSGWSAITQK